ncbi:methionine-R-sulfoxide reductase B1 isoform X2 [Coccinella septempunctata]|uniref:methionine-R-sulfoxide reductase B1 isoform X2 n=1 Tax=Coccinella septempunctata TaxID=41139 RepID=UPI001D05D0AD|nr:methionine-R-sulfoxide reductase B1 isoform X2 [Coccinella septempunctata]
MLCIRAFFRLTQHKLPHHQFNHYKRVSPIYTSACRRPHFFNFHLYTYKALKMVDKVDKSELKKKLTPMQYHVTQEKGTERPFTGCYDKTFEEGTYVCIVCQQPLFSSKTKFDSGCGWPAFNDVLDKGKVKLTPDTSGGRIRTEVTCSKCDAHLGHVFDDGPAPTRKRFCINSASLEFIPAKKSGDS